MAQRAAGPARPKKTKGKGGKPGLSDDIKKLAGGGKPGGKGAKVPNGSNSGRPVVSNLMQTVGAKDEENFLRWDKKIRGQHKVYLKARKLAADESSSLGGLYASAKEDGIPAHRLSVLKKLLKEEGRDKAEVVADHKEMAWQAKVTNSPLRQLGLFEMAEPTGDGYEELGYTAGKNGESMDNAPGKPGEERHTRFLDGFKRGQKESADAVFKATGAHPDNEETLEI